MRTPETGQVTVDFATVNYQNRNQNHNWPVLIRNNQLPVRFDSILSRTRTIIVFETGTRVPETWLPLYVFNKFKDKDGNFQKAISNDVKGILSLYEASSVSVHGEDILDEALTFTKPILESSLAMQSIPHHLAQHIRNALILSFHKGVPRVEARQYISVYEEDESPNQPLLEFAKLDFNRVQLLHRQELGELVRCNISAIDQLPYYMKDLYKTFLDLFEETRSICTMVQPQAAACFVGMGKFAGIKEYEWLKANPRIANAVKIIGRLLNDTVSHEDEQKRGGRASSVECYKKEYGVTEEMAVEEILEFCRNAWKDINEECMRQSSTPRPILECLVNIARITEVAYTFDDGYTNPSSLKDKVISLFLEPLALSK
ncbi:hypothetical protein JCGZ_25439 [Jatropha curcas]|uniref:Terpene synthase metal-binding domain-containing protein n=1 Tax=Jatropha curcas TaxID=180498 RepID=A0A067JPJ7_JATCU|nr:hypothetical protein JCGZ_25439 [Jatropha curcas]